MRLTARQVNRATLDRQLLLRRARLDVGDAVRRVLALQAQEPATPYLALWNRVADFDPTALDRALADRTVVKATLLRITLHVVHVQDYADVHHAVLPTLRASRLTDRRFLSSGLTGADADALLAPLARFTNDHPRSRAEVEAMLAERLGGPRQYVWWALRTFAPLHYAPTGGPWSFGANYRVVAARTQPARADHRASMRRVVLRYLDAFGPATAQDLGRIGQGQPAIHRALRELDGELERFEGRSGTTLYDLPGAPRPDEDVVAPPRLLPMWDNTLLAYADRSRIISPEYRELICRRNGNILPTLLVDGRVAGVWRPVPDGIEATAFHRLDAEAWAGLAAEADALIAFLADRDPAVYHQYDHWWEKDMPRAEVRILPG
jgi:hypothetical protein